MSDDTGEVIVSLQVQRDMANERVNDLYKAVALYQAAIKRILNGHPPADPWVDEAIIKANAIVDKRKP